MTISLDLAVLVMMVGCHIFEFNVFLSLLVITVESDGIDRELFKNDETLMEVEVVLCRFKHPTPEVGSVSLMTTCTCSMCNTLHYYS